MPRQHVKKHKRPVSGRTEYDKYVPYFMEPEFARERVRLLDREADAFDGMVRTQVRRWSCQTVKLFACVACLGNGCGYSVVKQMTLACDGSEVSQTVELFVCVLRVCVHGWVRARVHAMCVRVCASARVCVCFVKENLAM